MTTIIYDRYYRFQVTSNIGLLLVLLLLSIVLLLLPTTCHSQPVPTTEITFANDIVDSSCTFSFCSGEGGPCDCIYPFSGFKCFIPLVCINGTCTSVKSENTTCSVNNDCNELLGEYCVLEVDGIKRCQTAFYAGYGENCTQNYQCYLGMICPNGTCTTPPGGCYSQEQCPRDQACTSDGRCVPVTFAPGECNSLNTLSECFGFCVPKYRDSYIGVCNLTTYVGDICVVNKISCNPSLLQYCKQDWVGSAMGTCQTRPSTSFNTCFQMSDCSPWEYCRCDAFSSVGYCSPTSELLGKYCLSSLGFFYTCAHENDCNPDMASHPLSCSYEKCQDFVRCVKNFCVDPLLSKDVCVQQTCDLTKPIELLVAGIEIEDSQDELQKMYQQVIDQGIVDTKPAQARYFDTYHRDGLEQFYQFIRDSKDEIRKRNLLKEIKNIKKS
ncbi:hypothetical protein DFA_01367 [Cavenderia fasciculata]|uniref:EGF-like domain-containing protein n=1 Tax=Cavenderia fasciculata TaxID=261658 RepID=F4PSF1_CACFS|nr:uncharacterized protein DFA_01367 [Cavenderia fasciculata]EGG21481.1 hypothetical protein DFA_01367 [Cavenderia fasciculata]|eukprot:XP_004359331.1 hypothetical protein DFA_01367 [Cavenderia fasciculata]